MSATRPGLVASALCLTLGSVACQRHNVSIGPDTRLALLRTQVHPALLALSNPANPAGGGARYRGLLPALPADHPCTARDEAGLARALADPACTKVYVPNAASITVDRETPLQLRAGQVLYSRRGAGDSAGGVIRSTRLLSTPFVLLGDSARITGLRIEGADKETTQCPSRPKAEWYSCASARDGLVARGAVNVEIDNNEIFGWGSAAVYLDTGSTRERRSTSAHIHHNYIHHNRHHGLGYGVAVNAPAALIEWNVFDFYRHAIAATGRDDTGYEARYNLVLENSDDDAGYAFDVHQNQERGGSYVKIHHNVFRRAHPLYGAIRVEGTPRNGAFVFDNWGAVATGGPLVTAGERVAIASFGNTGAVADSGAGRSELSGDFDGDGLLDLLDIGADGEISVRRGLPDGFSKPGRWARVEPALAHAPARIKDLNADGRADLVFIVGSEIIAWVAGRDRFHHAREMTRPR